MAENPRPPPLIEATKISLPMKSANRKQRRAAGGAIIITD